MKYEIYKMKYFSHLFRSSNAFVQVRLSIGAAVLRLFVFEHVRFDKVCTICLKYEYIY